MYHIHERNYGVAIQCAVPQYTSEPLFLDKITHIQQVIGKLFYYAIAVYHTMIIALGELASTQAASTLKRNVANNVI